MSNITTGAEVVDTPEAGFVSEFGGVDEMIDESESITPLTEIKNDSGQNKAAADKLAADAKKPSEDTVDSEKKGEKKTGTEDKKSEKPVESSDKKTEDKKDASAGTPPGVQKRINKAIRQREDEIRAHAATKARLAELEAAQAAKPAETPAAVKAGEPKPEDNVPKRPVQSDFDDYEDYLTSLETYLEAKQEYSLKKYTADLEKTFEAKVAKAVESGKQEAKQKEANTAYHAKLENGRKRFADFDEVALADTVPYNVAMRDAVIASDKTDEIAYYLGSNLEEADRIASMSNPSLIALEIGKLDALISTGAIKLENVPDATSDSENIDTDKNNNKISNAPPPLTTVGGKGISVKDESQMTTEEFIKSRNRKEGLIR